MDVDSLRKSGKILTRVLHQAFSLLEYGERSGLKIADNVEGKIWESAKPAFPCNVGLDNIAAHFSPTDSEPTDLSSAQLVKIDAGVHIDGWITDAAFTYVFNDRYEYIARAAYDALYEAVHTIKPGVRVDEIGKRISDVAKKYGVEPIANLGGHQIKQYALHAGLFVPNVPEGRAVIEEGMLIAIEPFMTNGRGFVSNGSSVTIYSLERPRARSPIARNVLEYIKSEFGLLPFAQKWIERKFGQQSRLALYELTRNGSINQYPILLEKKGSVVAQFETTVYVDKDGAEILVDVFDLMGW